MRELPEIHGQLADFDSRLLRLRHFLRQAPKPDDYMSEYGKWYRRLQQLFKPKPEPDFFVQLRDGKQFANQKELAAFLTEQARGTVQYCEYCHLEVEPTGSACDNPFCTLEPTGVAGMFYEEDPNE